MNPRFFRAKVRKTFNHWTLLLALVAGPSLTRVEAQSWVQTSAPVSNWVAVACSADGMKMLAVSDPGLIYFSANSGLSWQPATAPFANWCAVTFSGDGSRGIAATKDGGVFNSEDGGLTWTESPTSPGTGIKSLAASSDGTNVIACGVGGPAVGPIFVSTNSGRSWNNPANPGPPPYSVASSADGTILAASIYGGTPYGGNAALVVSTNSFRTWWITDNDSLSAPSSVAVSADGSRLLVASIAGPLLLSTNTGASLQITAAPDSHWSGVASSSDGSKLVAVAGFYPPYNDSPGPIYTSDDGGVTWVSNSAPALSWSAVASSANGTTRFAAAYVGGIYTWHAPKLVPGTVLWTYDAGSEISSAPSVAADGTVIFSTYNGLVAVTNAGSIGASKWFFSTGLGPVSGPNSTPAIGPDGTIYFGSSDLHLYAVTPGGSQLWSFPFHSIPPTSPAIGADGTIYVEGDGILYALSAAGSYKWAYTNYGNGFPNSPSIGPDGTVYIGGGGRYLWAVTPEGLEKWVWGNQFVDPVGDSPAIGADGSIYATCGYLTAISQTGNSLWSTTRNDLTGAPALGSDGTIYVVDYGLERLCALGLKDQQVKWTALESVSNAPTTAALDAGGTIYHCAGNSLYALNPEGTVSWAVTHPGSPLLARTSPAIGPDGTVYAALGSTLYAVASGTNAPANSSWPMYRGNARHTGKIERPTIISPQRQTDGTVQLQVFANQLGQTYTVESSPDLKTWSALTNYIATTISTNFIDHSSASAAVRFYRARSAAQ